MEVINQIFAQLGANSSVLTQFVILTLFFLVMKFVVFDKLQFVLENRIEKTLNLESSADEKFEQINELAKKYNDEIEKAHVEAQEKLNKNKESFEADKNKVFKAKEDEMEKFIDENRASIQAEIAAKKTEILKETNTLAQDFVNKLSN